MTSIVKVKAPLNFSNGDLPHYVNRNSYEVADDKVEYLENVFVSYTGFCLNYQGLVKGSHHDYKSQNHSYESEAGHYYYDVVDNPDNLIVLNDSKTYVAIHHPWLNYYHWITESIFRLWLVKQHLRDLVLLIPETYNNESYITQSLMPFEVKTKFIIPKGKSLLVRKLCLPNIKPLCDSYNIIHLQNVRAFFSNYMKEKICSRKLKSDRIYVSRELAPRRKIFNEKDVQILTKKYGFETFHPENTSFLEQVAIFSSVKCVIAAHGSALTNMLFMSVGSSVLELHQEKTNDLPYPSPLFWYMSEGLEVDYYHQICSTNGLEDYFNGEYVVDVDLLENNIKVMITCNN